MGFPMKVLMQCVLRIKVTWQWKQIITGHNDLTYYDVISESVRSWIWGLIGQRGIKGWALSQFFNFTGSKHDDINKQILPIITVKM